MRKIPEGKVATYGQIATLAGKPRAARQVGYALAASSAAEGLPWQRVVNARGEISPRADPDAQALQRWLLEAEGVHFDPLGRINLRKFRWDADALKTIIDSGNTYDD